MELHLLNLERRWPSATGKFRAPQSPHRNAQAAAGSTQARIGW
jgi:hypothetical protein